jgi:hypothetical protein
MCSMSDKKLYSCILSAKIPFKTEFFKDKSIHLYIYQVFVYLRIIPASIFRFMYSFFEYVFTVCLHIESYLFYSIKKIWHFSEV